MRSNCITLSSFAEPFLMAATTSVLSHWNDTDVRNIWGPQTAQLRTIGTSSFAIMATGAHSLVHCHWGHSPPKRPRSPKNQRHQSGPPYLGYERCATGWLHSTHSGRCATSASLSGNPCSGVVVKFLFAATLYIPLTNVWPGRTTLAVWCSRPTRERISLFVALLRLSKSWMVVRV